MELGGVVDVWNRLGLMNSSTISSSPSPSVKQTFKGVENTKKSELKITSKLQKKKKMHNLDIRRPQ